jgi:hypothetical protein
MRALKLAAAVAVPLVMMIVVATGAALAQTPSTQAAPPVLEGVPPVQQVAGQPSLTLAARLHGPDGAPVRGEVLDFYVLSTVFGEHLMKVGQAQTDATGTAALLYEPTWAGEHTVVVRYAGSAYTPTQTTYRFNAAGPAHVHENARFGLEAVRSRAPIAAGLAVLAVWVTLALAATRTVRGIRAAAPITPSGPPLVRMPAALSPAPLRPVLLAIVVVIATALPIAWFQARDGRSEPSASAGALLAPSSNEPGGEKLLPAGLVQFVPAITTDAAGQLTPDSADLPADVALVQDRKFVLDTNKGRILTVTPAGKLARMFESDRDGETSILGASAITSHDGNLYVASPRFGTVMVLSPFGKIEDLVKVELPAAEHPFRPSGIAVSGDGQIWLSDANNHRVVSVDQRGRFLGSIGKGAASSDETGFDTPGGLAVDALDNLWVADTGNHEVKKYSPKGVFLAAVGHHELARPEAVAVDDQGNVFVTDDERRAVFAFGPDGTFLGSFGRDVAARHQSPAGLQSPGGIKVNGTTVYVMDRLSGLFVFSIAAAGAP